MKFSCNQQSLSKALNIVSKAVTSRTTIPILKGILLKVNNDGQLTMSASDLDLSIEKTLEVENARAGEVVVYAKLPRTFQIPTPVGNYAPDWAIAMKKNDVKHIFFVAETKGSMSSMDLSAIERAKIDCAEKLFNSISTANVKYHKVATYRDLIDGMNAIG